MCNRGSRGAYAQREAPLSTFLASPENWPFLVSLLVGAGLVGVSDLGSSDHDAGHDLDVAHPVGDVLGWFGVGKAPIGVLLQVLLLSFGSLGLLLNAVLRDLAQVRAPWATLPLALVGALGAVRAAAGLVAKIAPPDGQTARRTGEFVGQLGVTASSVSSAIGQVTVDAGPHTPPALLNAAVDPTHGREIPRGTEVLLVAYDRERGLYHVAPAPNLIARPSAPHE